MKKSGWFKFFLPWFIFFLWGIVNFYLTYPLWQLEKNLRLYSREKNKVYLEKTLVLSKKIKQDCHYPQMILGWWEFKLFYSYRK